MFSLCVENAIIIIKVTKTDFASNLLFLQNTTVDV